MPRMAQTETTNIIGIAVPSERMGVLIGQLPALVGLSFQGCDKLTTLPDSFRVQVVDCVAELVALTEFRRPQPH